MKKQRKKYNFKEKFLWKRIETFVLFAFIIRLYGIVFPPIEVVHSWRQTLTCMIARNFNEGGFHLFYPKIDMGGPYTGIIGSEFPFFQMLIATCNSVFGYEHWYGRLINLIICSIASICFHRILKEIFNQRTASYAVVLLTISLWFSFSRKIMPDTVAVSFVIIGIYFAMKYIQFRKFWFWIIAFFFITLGILVKIPAIYLMTLLLPVLITNKIAFSTRLRLFVLGFFSVAVSLSWYFIWVPHLVETYHFQLFFEKGIIEGWLEIKPLIGDAIHQLFWGGMRGYLWLFTFILGCVWIVKSRNKNFALAFSLLFSCFLVFALKSGAVFPTHNYYILPIVPVLATISAIGLQQFTNKWAIFILCILSVESLGNQLSDFSYYKEDYYKLNLENDLNKVLINRNEKIVLLSGANPELMYWFHRKGWNINEKDLTNTSKINSIIKSGTKYFILMKDQNKQSVPFKQFEKTKQFTVYDLSKNQK